MYTNNKKSDDFSDPLRVTLKHDREQLHARREEKKNAK